MTDEVMALLSTGATTLAAAAATDAWAVARAGFLRLFGRGDARREADAARRLDALATAVRQAPAETRDQLLRDQQADWRVRLKDLVDDDPIVIAELQTLVAELAAQLPEEQQVWVQHNTATGQGQVFAAQGGDVIVYQAPPTSEG